MPLRLKGDAPKPGEADRRYYMIDVQEGLRRVRISSGTRNRELAERKEQQVLDAVRENPSITQAELQAIIRGAMRASQASLARVGPGLTLKEACDEALNDRQPWGKSRKGWAEAGSRDTYATNCRSIQKYLGASTPIARISQESVDKLVEDLLDDENTKTTVNRKVFCLLSVMRRLQERGKFTGAIPRFRPFDESGTAREFVFTPQQERELFDSVLALDTLPMTVAGGHPRKRDAHDYLDLFSVLVDVGCRLTAGIKIRWADIYEDDGVHFVRFWRQSEQKGGKTRTTPLTARAAQIINARRVRGGYGPFAGMTKRRAQHLWSDAKSRTSLATEREAVIHALRHTCAVRMLQATGDIKLVQEWLGHTDIKTTSATYAKVLTDHKVAALKVFEEKWATGAGIPTTGSFRDRYSPETGTSPKVTH